MRLSAKGRYAVTCTMDLALHSQHGPVTLAGISQRQGLSLSYLEQLFANLREAGLVQGVRGPGGGYRLAKSAESISVADVIVAVEARVDATACQGGEDCGDGDRCLTHDLWADLSAQIQGFLGGISLQALMDSEALATVLPRQALA